MTGMERRVQIIVEPNKLTYRATVISVEEQKDVMSYLRKFSEEAVIAGEVLHIEAIRHK